MHHLSKRTALTALATLALLSTAHAVAQGETTHLGTKSNRIVNLEWYFDAATICPDNNQGKKSFFRLKATGAREATPFVVPAGNRLIITDVSWLASPNPNPGFNAGNLLRIYLNARRPDGSSQGQFYISDGLAITATTSVARGGSDHFTSGVAVAPGRLICARANALSPSGSSTHYPREVRISGYLSKI